MRWSDEGERGEKNTEVKEIKAEEKKSEQDRFLEVTESRETGVRRRKRWVRQNKRWREGER